MRQKRHYMRKPYILLFLASCLGGMSPAQTLTQARQLFSDGQYEKAKPAFRKLVKQSPGNANYNYWYGACLYETGEKAASEEFLKKAAQHNVAEALRYLAEAQADQYRFDEAAESLRKYIGTRQKKKADTADAEKRLERIRQGGRMLKGTEQVTFVDSFVVDKSLFLSAYKVGPESGTLDTYNHYFQTDAQPESMLYQTELKNRIYYAMPRKDTLALYARDKLADQWGEATPLQGLNARGNANYPYVLSDGVTLYYASDGEGSLGGYDIFVTRYNSETDRYLRPENIGMPFNSPANDYLYVIDEYNRLGWFASDRHQPEGKVCVYVFIPNDTRMTFDYEHTDEATVRQAAMIQRIASTWKNEETVRAARQRLTMVTYQQPEKRPRHDFEFIIDDQTTYYVTEDFKSPQAKRLFLQWQQSRKDFSDLSRSLEAKRQLYHESAPARRQALSPEIMDLERKAESMEADLMEMEINIRNTEKKFISK